MEGFQGAENASDDVREMFDITITQPPHVGGAGEVELDTSNAFTYTLRPFSLEVSIQTTEMFFGEWKIGFVQAIMSPSTIMAEYNGAGIASWEMSSQSSTHVYEMLHDGQMLYAPWITNSPDLVRVIRDPLVKPITLSLYDAPRNMFPKEYYGPHGPTTNALGHIKYVRDTRKYTTWLVAEELATGQMHILNTVQWFRNTEFDVERSGDRELVASIRNYGTYSLPPKVLSDDTFIQIPPNVIHPKGRCWSYTWKPTKAHNRSTLVKNATLKSPKIDPYAPSLPTTVWDKIVRTRGDGDLVSRQRLARVNSTFYAMADRIAHFPILSVDPQAWAHPVLKDNPGATRYVKAKVFQVVLGPTSDAYKRLKHMFHHAGDLDKLFVKIEYIGDGLLFIQRGVYLNRPRAEIPYQAPLVITLSQPTV